MQSREEQVSKAYSLMSETNCASTTKGQVECNNSVGRESTVIANHELICKVKNDKSCILVEMAWKILIKKWKGPKKDKSCMFLETLNDS